MELSVRKDREAVIVSVTGRLDTLSAPEFQSQMEQLLEEGAHKLVLDLAEVEYVSSAGLRSILITAKKARNQGGAATCCTLQPIVRQVFDVSGFTRMVPVFDSLNDALAEQT